MYVEWGFIRLDLQSLSPSTSHTIVCKLVTNSILLLYEALCTIIMPRAQYCLNGYFVDIGSTSLTKKLLQNVAFPDRKFATDWRQVKAIYPLTSRLLSLAEGSVPSSAHPSLSDRIQLSHRIPMWEGGRKCARKPRCGSALCTYRELSMRLEKPLSSWRQPTTLSARGGLWEGLGKERGGSFAHPPHSIHSPRLKTEVLK